MSNREQRLQELYKRFLANNLSAGELDEFLQIMSHPSNEQQAKKLMDLTWQEINDTERRTPVVSISRKSWFRFAASAAAIILALFIFDYFNSRPGDTMPTVKTPLKAIKQAVRDPAPGRNLATLTLANGAQIILDSSGAGAIARQGSAKIVKLSPGKLSYTNTGAGNEEVLYNTLTTPRGGQYRIELPDGSRVWLNAASSLHFPTVFIGAQRTVDLAGEAYFEVSKNRKMPFIVRVNGSEVKVLGTHFNINGYGDEAVTKTTVLEGAVEVSNGKAKEQLLPGQQTQLSPSGEIRKIAFADTEEAVAWKNGYFQFNKLDIESIMKQVSRWYDLDVQYEGKKPAGHFMGKISRSVHLSEMLKVIEASGVHFKLEGKILKVMS